MASSPDSPRQPAPQEPDSPEAVYRREWRPLYGLIYRAVRRRDDAHDLTQEVFARALPTLDRAPPGLRVRAFLNTIARNLLRDRWRRRSPEFVALNERSPRPDPTADPLDQALSAAEREPPSCLSVGRHRVPHRSPAPTSRSPPRATATPPRLAHHRRGSPRAHPQRRLRPLRRRHRATG